MRRLWPFILLMFIAATAQEDNLFRIARASYSDRLYDLASRQCAEFLQKFPQSDRAEAVTLLLAQTQYQQGDYGSCMVTLRKGLQQWPEGASLRAEFLFWLGEAQVKMERYADAESSYAQIVRKHPTSPLTTKAYYGMAFAQFKQERFKQALTTIQRLIENDAGGDLAGPAQLLEGQILLGQTDFAAAQATFQHVIDQFPQTTTFYEANYWLAETLVRIKEFEPAIRRYKVVTEAQKGVPNDWVTPNLAARAWFGIGWAHWSLGQFTRASTAFDTAAGLATDPPVRHDALLKRAEASARAGSTDMAIAQFTEFLTAYPKDTSADLVHMAIADLLTQAKKWESALQEYNLLIAQYPSSTLVADAHFQAGFCAMELSNPTDAKQSFLAAFESTTNRELAQKALFHLGDVLYQLKEYNEAIEYYQRLIGTYPKTPYLDRALFQLGHAYWQLRNADGAITSFESLLQQIPGSPLAAAAQYQVGEIQAQEGKGEAARAAFGQVETQWPNTELAYRAACAIGNSLQVDGRYQDALAKYDAIIALPDVPPAFAQQAAYSRGWCFARMGDTDKARDTFAAFLNSQPQSDYAPDAQFWLAQYYLAQRDFLKAQEQFQLISQTYTNSPLAPDALYMAGRTSYARQDYKGAIDIYESLLKTYPTSTWCCQARFGQGDALTELSEFGKALNIFETLVKDYPNCPLISEANGRKGDCHFTLNQFDLAMASYRTALDLAANSPAALRNQLRFKIGQCYERSGQLDDAFEYYGRVLQEAAVAPATDEPPERFWTGKAGLAAGAIKEQQDQWRDAITVYEKLITLTPDLRPVLEDRIRKIRTQHGILFP